jgi:hypothetical protein
MNFKLRKITEKDDAAVAGLVRENLNSLFLLANKASTHEQH